MLALSCHEVVNSCLGSRSETGPTMAEPKPRDDRKYERNPEYDDFQRLLKGVLAVPKEEVDKRRKEYERERNGRRAG